MYEELSKQSSLIGYEVKNRFYEVGSKDGIKDLSKHLIKKIMNYSDKHLSETTEIINKIDTSIIEKMADIILKQN